MKRGEVKASPLAEISSMDKGKCSKCGGSGPFPPHGRRYKECLAKANRAKQQKWRKGNPEKSVSLVKRYQEKNPQKKREWNRAYMRPEPPKRRLKKDKNH